MKDDVPLYGTEHEPHDRFLYLGRHAWNGTVYDLRWGPDAVEVTVIARWSPHGPDYGSGMVFGWVIGQPDHPLVEARRRAEALGLDVCREKYAHRSGEAGP